MEKDSETARSSKLPNSSRSALHEQFEAARPLYPDNNSAVTALSVELDQLATLHNLSVKTLLQEAHTSSHYQPHYQAALNLERQINLLKS